MVSSATLSAVTDSCPIQWKLCVFLSFCLFCFSSRFGRCDWGITKPTVGQRKKVTAVTFFPARPRSDQRGTNTGQIRKVPVDEIAWFLVYRMNVTRSQLRANDMILVCLVREIWQFKVFAGKEVTALPATRGEGGYWRRRRRLLCLCWNWIALSFLKHWK